MLMMMGVVFLKSRRLEIFILQNIRGHMVIKVMLFTRIIYNIQEYVECIQGEKINPHICVP